MLLPMKPECLVAAAVLLLVTVHSHAQPTTDYHQHLLSPSAAALGGLPGSVDTKTLIGLLDGAGVHWALVLSLA